MSQTKTFLFILNDNNNGNEFLDREQDVLERQERCDGPGSFEQARRQPHIDSRAHPAAEIRHFSFSECGRWYLSVTNVVT